MSRTPSLSQPVDLADGVGLRSISPQRPVSPVRHRLAQVLGQQLPAHPVQLADMAPPEGDAGTSPAVDALTMHPSTEDGPPRTAAQASSMQSPPASAEATSAQHLVSRFALARLRAHTRGPSLTVNEFTQPAHLGQGGRKKARHC